jgi:hypothetical protein
MRRLDASRALPALVPLLGDPDLRDQAARELGAMAEEAREPLLAALRTPELEAGALKALQGMPAEGLEPVESFAASAAARALHYDGLRHAVAAQGPRQQLLQDVLREKAHSHAARAIQAVGLLSDPQAVAIALESLAGEDMAQQAHALETLESLRASAIIRPLFMLWDEGARPATVPAAGPAPTALLEDPDPWVRDCAVFAAQPEGDRSMDTLPTLSLMERLLFFRRVPLFAGLTTLDLKNVAAIAEEMLFEDGTPIALQNEPGHVMHLVIAGEILVITCPPGGSPREIARRGPGDIVGEMALISDQPRMADLIASGDVRTLCIDRRNFQALLRERPEVSLAVMNELCARVTQLAQGTAE